MLNIASFVVFGCTVYAYSIKSDFVVLGIQIKAICLCTYASSRYLVDIS